MILPRLFVNFVSFCKIRVHPCSSVVKFLLAVCLLFLSGSLLAAPAPKLAPDSRDEESLIKVLQSNASPHDKDAACARLKLIGTVKSIPALAALLTDEQLSHSARYALEPMSAPEAGRALIDALPKTSGMIKVGIINSLGARHESHALPALAKMSADPDPAVAAAAASALGHIGGPEAVKALEQSDWPRSGPVHDAVLDATLRCANEMLAEKKPDYALPLYQRVYAEDKNWLRVAGYRGIILSSGRKGVGLMTEAISGQASPAQVAALQLVRDIEPKNATKAFVELLPQLGPTVQIALIGGLAQRADPAAATEIAKLAGHTGNADVRVAALKALGTLGSDETIQVLAEDAAAGTPDEQAAARRSLVTVNRGKVTDKLLDLLTTTKPAVQIEVARALGERGDAAAVPKLIDLAQKGSESSRKAALQALALLAEQRDLRSLVNLVQQSPTDTARGHAVETLNSACQHILAKTGRLDAEPIAKAITTGSPQDKIALLPVCSGLIDPEVRAALRASLDNPPNAQVRDAALRALCDTKDPELLPDLIKVAWTIKADSFRTLAVGACVRLTTQEEGVKLTLPQRLDTLKQLFSAPLRADQKRLILAGLSELQVPESLALVEPLLDDAEVKNEAAQAVIKIAPALLSSQAAKANAALKKAFNVASNDASRRAAEDVLKRNLASSQFITSWLAAGPYVQEGKDYSALFDIAFLPETRDAAKAHWLPLPRSTDAAKPWLMDLLKAFGGEERVAYARTWAYCEKEQPARLEIGSDDGVRVWLNDTLVHSHNTARAVQPGADKVNVTLKAGWNSLLLKVTQLNQGWGFCVRILKPDGSPIEGLRYDAEHTGK
jgi:HEAT repeat protein